MKKNYFSILAVAALVSLGACGGGEQAETEAEGTIVGGDTAMVTTTDTAMAPVVTTDTAAVVTDTMVQADTAVTTDTIQQ